jgi:PAS domain S-box-containing protein
MLTRRVEQLVKAAEQLTLGDLNARSGLSGLDELARLSQAFDAMAAEIADTQTRLRQDIAERIRVQQALEDSEARLQQILNNTTAVVYVKDSAGQYSLINRQHERLFHRKQAQVVGKTDAEIFSKEIADEFRRNDLRVLEKNAPIEFEETVPHDDGLHTYISLKFPLFNGCSTRGDLLN